MPLFRPGLSALITLAGKASAGKVQKMWAVGWQQQTPPCAFCYRHFPSFFFQVLLSMIVSVKSRPASASVVSKFCSDAVSFIHGRRNAQHIT